MTRATDILLRPALKHESRTIAELYRISSDGVADLPVVPHALIHYTGDAPLMVKDI